ncbi:MAG TPA: hypothetical protein VF790_13760 [Dissulfurispiraceae bacterium]
MQAKRYAKFVVLLLTLALLLPTIAIAAGDQKFSMRATPYAPQARGDLIMRDTEGTVRGVPQKEITVQAAGLHPNSLYTVWLANDKPQPQFSKLGEGDNSFRSDAKGFGTFTALVPVSDLSNWKSVEVAFQPTGDLNDVRTRQFALRSNIQ